MRRAGLLLQGCSLIVLLAACSTAKPPPEPDLALPAAYPGGAAAASTAPPGDWWKLFGDPALDTLVEQANAHNVDLRIAASRIDEAAVALGLVRAARWPQIDLGAAVTRSRASELAGQPVSGGGAESTLHRVALATNFEIDLWGRLRNAESAAQLQLLATQYTRDAVRVALAATVAQTYFGLRALDVQIDVLDDQIRERRESLSLVERRAEGGVASGLEVAQARAALAASASQRPDLLRQRALLSNQLGVLTGQLGLVLGKVQQALPSPATPPAGLPSELLERRADVQQSQVAMRASFETFEVVRKGTWPVLALTASFGAQSTDLADLLKSGARMWSIGPTLLATIFDAGRNMARTDEARVRAEQAALNYQRTVQTAFREVSDALVGAEQAAAQEAEIEQLRSASAEALRIATRRYEAGYSGYLEVLVAQRSVQEAELAAVRTRQARLDASVALIKALGGGWVPAAP